MHFQVLSLAVSWCFASSWLHCSGCFSAAGGSVGALNDVPKEAKR